MGCGRSVVVVISSFSGLCHGVREAAKVGDSEMAGKAGKGSDPISTKVRLFRY